METIDDEVTKASLDYLEHAKKADKPFFLWWNSTRMHIWTHLKKESQGKTGLGVYPDGMVEHDAEVGQLLDKLKELGLDDNTIVMYSTDNGAEKFSWPDGGTSPFRNEKASNWEGAFRVPARRQGTALEGDEGGQRHLQGPPGRLQHRRHTCRQGARSAEGVLLLQR